jgi:hypothetical protein
VNFYATSYEEGIKFWDLPVHITGKTWMRADPQYITDFNSAFQFAQNLFSEHKPDDAHNVNEAYTLRLLRELLAAR